MFPVRLVVAVLVVAALTRIAHAEESQDKIRQASAKIDALLTAHWKATGVPPGDPIPDETFVRRVYLDLAGRIPTPTEATAFLRLSGSDKRADLIQELLGRESYVSHFYHFWADLLRAKSGFSNTANVVPAAYIAYLRDSLRTNKPYDRLVYEMLSAKGKAWENGAIGYYLRDPEMPLDNMALTARVFLGTRIECAQCHDHPFDKWKQTQFYHLAAYTYRNRMVNEAFDGARDVIRERQKAIENAFKKEKTTATDGGKAANERKKQRLEAMQYRKVVSIIKNPVGQLLSPVGLYRKRDVELNLPSDFHQSDGEPGSVMAPAPLFGTAPALSRSGDPAEAFARWTTSPNNPRFTRVIVNRHAKHAQDTAKQKELAHREGELRRERGEAMVREFIMPLLENLARQTSGPGIHPSVDKTYVMNTNPALLVTETWRRMYGSRQ